MRFGPVIAASAFGLVSACEGPLNVIDEMLVDRFDVSECAGIEALRIAGSREENMQKVIREYRADNGCLSALEKAALTFDFSETLPSVYVARREKGWTETLIIARQNAGSEANVFWEEIYP